MMLAQTPTTTTQPAGDFLQRIFEYVGRFELPSREEFVTTLQTLHPLQSVALIIAGILFLFCGYRCFKVLVVVNAGAIGALLGLRLSQIGRFSGWENAPLLMTAAGAILLAVVAWPALKYSVCLMGALAGGLIGYGLWHFVATSIGNEGLRGHAWAGGIIGLILVSMLTFTIFRVAVMIFTCLQGAVMGIAGAAALLMAHPGLRDSIQTELTQNEFMLNVLIGVPAVACFVFQWASDTGKIRKKREATEKPPV